MTKARELVRHITYLRDHENTTLRTLRYIVSFLDHLDAKGLVIRELQARV